MTVLWVSRRWVVDGERGSAKEEGIGLELEPGSDGQGSVRFSAIGSGLTATSPADQEPDLVTHTALFAFWLPEGPDWPFLNHLQNFGWQNLEIIPGFLHVAQKH